MGDATDRLESQEFFELMQVYRHAPWSDQNTTVAAFEAVKAFVRQCDWQPIETAPRDAGRVLVACQTDNGWDFEVSYQNEKGNWIYQNCEPFFCLGWYMEPKFWQPLPPPPATAKE